MSTELDVRVAGAMGWKHSVVGNYPWQMTPPGESNLVFCLPHYSTDIAASWQMEDWIDSQNDDTIYSYAYALLDILGLTPDTYGIALSYLVWAIVHATPEQRCRAFLKVMEA